MHIISNEQPCRIDPINYQALIFLESLGNREPSQDQVDEAEIIIRQRLDECILQFKFLRDNPDLDSLSGKSMYELIRFLTMRTNCQTDLKKAENIFYANQA